MALDDVSRTFVDRGQPGPKRARSSGELEGVDLGEPTDLGLLGEPEEVEPVYEPPGRLIAGQYRIERPLAHGGMGSVYLASQIGLERRVALKALSSNDPELLERFRREAVALAEVSHPGVVEIYDFIPGSAQTQGRCYLIMAFIDGVDLEAHIRSQPERRLAPQAVVELVLPVCSALVELHAKGIIHRDLKPANLVRYVRADGRAFAKLVDFGIARREVDPGLTATGSVLGTPAYLAPEAMFGRKQTPLSDVYSFGATLFELLSGAPPFGDGKPVDIIKRVMEHRIDLPPDVAGTPLEALIVRMLEMEPARRPTSLDVFETVEGLAHGFGERPGSARTFPTQPPLPQGGAGSAARDLSLRKTRPTGVTAMPEGALPDTAPGGYPAGPSAIPMADQNADPFALPGLPTQALPVDHTDPVGVPLPSPGRAAPRPPGRGLVLGLGIAAASLGALVALFGVLWGGARRDAGAQRARADRAEARAKAFAKPRPGPDEDTHRARGAVPPRTPPGRAAPRGATPDAPRLPDSPDADVPAPRAAPPDAAAPTTRTEPAADAHGPTEEMLKAACKRTADAQALLRASRRAYERRGGDLERARRGLRALLLGDCAPLRLKRTAAEYLLQLHLKRRECDAARAAHAALAGIHRRLGRRAPRFPGCR